MAGLSVAERRRLAEIERHLSDDERLTAVLTRGFERGDRRPTRLHNRDTRFTLALPWVLLVSWIVLGLLYGALLAGTTAPIMAAGAVVAAAVLLTVRRIRRDTRPRRRAEGRAR